MKWNEVEITTSREAVDTLTDYFAQMGVNAVINDPMDIVNYKPPAEWALLDENLIPEKLDDVFIKVYFPENNDIRVALKEINSKVKDISKYINVGNFAVKTTLLDEVDWETSWKQYYKPQKVTDKIVIKPSWEEYSPSKDDIIIELDPGMAFGTGTHETTRMCMKLIEKCLKSEQTVLDIGCGSGILGICASKLGASKVLGIDLDSVAVKVSSENIKINNVKNMVVKQGNLLDSVNEKFDVIIANIIADIIIKLADDVNKYMASDGIFIASGIIKDRLQDVKNSLTENGYEIIDIITENEWAAVVSRR